MPEHTKKTSVSVSKQDNTIDALLIYYLDSFNSNNLFKDFNINKIEINSIAKRSLLNKTITIVKSKIINLKSKKEQL